MPLMSRPRSGSTASLPGGRNFLPPEMRGVEHGCAPHRVKRTTPNGVLGQAGCTVSRRPKTTELQSRFARPNSWDIPFGMELFEFEGGSAHQWGG